MGGSRSAGCLALRGEGSLADGLAHLGRCTRSGHLPAMALATLKDARPGPLDAAQDWGGGVLVPGDCLGPGRLSAGRRGEKPHWGWTPARTLSLRVTFAIQLQSSSFWASETHEVDGA